MMLHLLYFYLSIVDNTVLGFRCATQWFDICIHYKMSTVMSLGTTRPHGSHHSLATTSLFCTSHALGCRDLYLLISFTYLAHLPRSSPLATTHLFSMSVSLFFILFVCLLCFLDCILFYFCFLGPHPQRMEVPRLGVESERQLPVYTIATATQDP